MNNSFIFGDALTIIKKLPDKSIDLILTDPPYDIRKYSENNSKKNHIKAYKYMYY